MHVRGHARHPLAHPRTDADRAERLLEKLRHDGPPERDTRSGSTTRGPASSSTALTTFSPSPWTPTCSARVSTGGARNAAADRLGMSRTTLWRKMKEYGLEA
ncbi:MAG TPA: hypothetical protein EYQ27_21320 [Gemmatimonadetes bacterium]|nr:hypothetical protein [Gemmatimonadota bacterium]